MTVPQILGRTRSLEDLPHLARDLGCSPAWEDVPLDYWISRPGVPPPCSRSALIGRLGSLPWYAIETDRPARVSRSVADLLRRRGEPAAILAIEPGTGTLALSVAFQGVPVLQLVPALDDDVVAACFRKIPAILSESRLATAARLAEILAMEGTGTRFFTAFESQLARLAGCIDLPREEERRDLALLQLNRVLFLYFVESKGWLDGRRDFLRTQVDHCLARRKGLDRHLLRPLFFGTLNRPAPERSRAARAFGRIPFLNGGLFEPHPLERRWKGTIPNSVWRDAVDGLFERFQFTATEGVTGAIAPDMLGRVFEGVMAPEERSRSGTFYTPPRLVRTLIDECLVVFLSRRLGISPVHAAELLEARDSRIAPVLKNLSLLDPAAGSGAFLLAALERLCELSGSALHHRSAIRRRILQTNLFGVDINPTAVRLAELRLWLSVIADDPTESPHDVAPLPNLDCLVRQGDSLTDPLGLISRMPFRSGAMGSALAGLRLAFSAATGSAKRDAARALRKAELGAMQECLDLAEKMLSQGIADALRTARSSNLFGERRGADRAISRRLVELRRKIVPIRQARRRLNLQGQVGWFQYESHFADVFSSGGGFDLVIGNPPWVRAERLAPAVREHLAGRYCWWRGERATSGGYQHQPDLAVAFLERSHELARPGGVVGLLVPSKVGSASYATTARRALARDLTLHVVADLASSCSAAFDATVYPMALVTTKERPGADHPVRLELMRPQGPSVLQSGLGAGPWIVRHSSAGAIARDLTHRFASIASRHAIHLGVKTGANEVFLNPPETIEPHLVRQAFRGRDIRPFQILGLVPILWPLGEDQRPLNELPPSALAHVRVHRRKLESRADYQGGPYWSLFRTAAAVAGPRVVWADLSRRLSAVALDERDRRIPLNTCYVVRTVHVQAVTLAAWLNSSWMRGLARLLADPASSGFARFNARTVGSLPLPETVGSDPALARWAIRASAGNHLQAELDELTAPHLGLTAAELRTLASVA